jgi:hypothetical protein
MIAKKKVVILITSHFTDCINPAQYTQTNKRQHSDAATMKMQKCVYCLQTLLHVTGQESQNVSSLNFILGTINKICPDIPILVKIR